MAKMTQTEALALLTGATDLIARMASLIPTLTQAVSDAASGLAETDEAALNDKIALAHGDIQSLDAQLQSLRNA